MVTGYQQLNGLLDRVHHVLVVVHDDGRIPKTSAYQPVRAMVSNGFSFSIREFVHAIGCKMANLPSDDVDQALSYASIYMAILDLESPYLVYKDEMGYGSDFQTIYSHGVGVGMSCLIASKCLGIPYDQFEPIPGPETRFDYRGESRNLRCVIESRGTKYKDTQYSQVGRGIEKKATCKKRGDKFDIGLVVSTCIGLKPERPRIVIADPKYSGTMFGKDSEMYYRYRHFVRVMQFIGATPLSRALFVESNNILQGKQSKQFFFKNQSFHTTEEIAEIVVDNSVYIGRWIDDWIPKESFRYRRLKSIRLPSPLKSRPKMKLSVFQGLSYMNFQAIMDGGMEDIVMTTGEKLASIRETKNGAIASVFPDGTILIFKEHA